MFVLQPARDSLYSCALACESAVLLVLLLWQDKREWMETTLAFYEKFSWDMVLGTPSYYNVSPPPHFTLRGLRPNSFVCDTPSPVSTLETLAQWLVCPHPPPALPRLVAPLQTVSNTHVTIPQLMQAVMSVLSERSPRVHVRPTPPSS